MITFAVGEKGQTKRAEDRTRRALETLDLVRFGRCIGNRSPMRGGSIGAPLCPRHPVELAAVLGTASGSTAAPALAGQTERRAPAPPAARTWVARGKVSDTRRTALPVRASRCRGEACACFSISGGRPSITGFHYTLGRLHYLRGRLPPTPYWLGHPHRGRALFGYLKNIQHPKTTITLLLLLRFRPWYARIAQKTAQIARNLLKTRSFKKHGISAHHVSEALPTLP